MNRRDSIRIDRVQRARIRNVERDFVKFVQELQVFEN